MTKKTTTKLGGIGGFGDQHLETHEPGITKYERLRMKRIKENMSKMQELGLKEKAMSLMATVQNSRSNFSNHNMNKDSAEDGLYSPKQDSDMEHELDSSNEELLLPHSKTNLKSKTIPWKIRKMKALTRKAVIVALAFQKRRQKVHLASSDGGSSTPNHTSQQPVKSLGSKVEHLNQNENDKENGEKDKPRRGPTMYYDVHGCNEEERLKIILNEHGQTNILPLNVKSRTILRNKKKEELWDYVSKHCIVAVMKEVEKKHAKEVEAMQIKYEDKRQQDKREMANGLRSFSQLQQRNPQMSFDLSMFGSLFCDSQSERDDNSTEMLQLHSLASTSKGLNSKYGK